MRIQKFELMRLHQRSILLKEYDYSQPGAYFVTIAAFQHECLFGEIINQELRLNEYGKIAEECWRTIPEHFPNVELGAYVAMPNHVHGIIVIHENKSLPSVGARHASPLRPHGAKPNSLGAIVGSFKSAVTKRIGQKNIWQRNYYEHIIHNEKEWDKIHRYIESNPVNWELDNETPLNL